jgi:hypothetical protein
MLRSGRPTRPMHLHPPLIGSLTALKSVNGKCQKKIVVHLFPSLPRLGSCPFIEGVGPDSLDFSWDPNFLKPEAPIHDQLTT